MANLDIITTLFLNRDAGRIELHVYICVFICHFYKRKQRLLFKPSDNIQRRNNVISMLLIIYEAGCHRTDVVLMSV